MDLTASFKRKKRAVMGWLIDCKRSRRFLQSKTAAAAPGNRVAAGAGWGVCAISERGGLGGSWWGLLPSCAEPEPLHSLPLVGTCSLDVCPKQRGM